MAIAAPPEHRADVATPQPAVGWTDPQPARVYDLIVIGAGSAAVAAARFAAGYRARTAIMLGPVGPGRARGARARKQLLHLASESRDGFAEPELLAALARIEQARSAGGPEQTAWDLTAAGVDVFRQPARFTARDSLEVNGHPVRFVRGIVALSAAPKTPAIAGLDAVGFRTSETIFEVDRLPRALAVIGATAAACELAQAFRRFGSEVHVLAPAEGLLPGEDRQAAQVVCGQLAAEGIKIYAGAQASEVRRTGRRVSVVVESGEAKRELLVDEILLDVGSRPQLAGLSLDEAHVVLRGDRIDVNAHYQSSNPAIFAIGEACGPTGIALEPRAAARLAVRNALFFRRQSADARGIARVTQTAPAIVQLGWMAEEAAAQGVALDRWRVGLGSSDDCEQERGFVTVYTRHETGKVVGMTLVGAEAASWLGPLSMVVRRGMSLDELATVADDESLGSIDMAEALRQVAQSLASQQRRPLVERVAERYFAWRRRAVAADRVPIGAAIRAKLVRRTGGWWATRRGPH
jgi:pyruvate/2-oxoglutarate dehydrogenase complex dihydrolipoamide dehydrogenase (E3) component